MRDAARARDQSCQNVDCAWRPARTEFLYGLRISRIGSAGSSSGGAFDWFRVVTMRSINFHVRRFLFVIVLVGFSAGNAGSAFSAVLLTDSSVFSANSSGENWNGWIWNTQAPPVDTPNRWNLYYSSSSDPMNPVFINSENDSSTNINIAMTAGSHSFLIYGEAVTTSLDPMQHFVLNLYFGGNQAAPDISALHGQSCAGVCAASHWNGLDLFGNSGLGGNTDAQEAGTLIYASGGSQILLTGFTWAIDEGVDEVWPHWDNTLPYGGGSGTPDFVGEITLRVTQVPEPPTLAILLFGLLAVAAASRRRNRRKAVESFQNSR